MTRIQLWATAVLAALAAASGGCGGRALAPVSGVVTVNGKPLEGAAVTFQPAGVGSGADSPGSSFGRTDAAGRYELKTVQGQKSGAAVGKHVVAISLYAAGAADSDRGTKESLPPKYNVQSELTFDVPSGGSDAANFDLRK